MIFIITTHLDLHMSTRTYHFKPNMALCNSKCMPKITIILATCAAIPVHWDQEAQNHFRCGVNGFSSNGDTRTDKMSPWGPKEVDGIKRLLKSKPEHHTHNLLKYTRANTQEEIWHTRSGYASIFLSWKNKWTNKDLDWHTIGQPTW